MAEKLPPLLTANKDGSITIKQARLSYEHVFKKWKKDPDNDRETARYSATAILDKKKHAAEIEWIRARLLEIQKNDFKSRLPSDKLCLRDGDETGKPEYEGAWILVASDTKVRPIVVNKDGRTPITEEDDILYSGCTINMRFSFWNQNNKHGKRINANLIGVQFIADGERFASSNRPAADEAFEDEAFDDDNGNDGFD